MRLAIVSQSARVYAQMAQREGFEVLAVDAFADRDTAQAAHEVWQLPALCERLGPADIKALMHILDAWQPDALLIGSGFEADIACYETLSQRYRVLGNSPAVIRQVKNPQWLASYCGAHGVTTPKVQAQLPLDGQWLYKVEGQCGGSHIRDWPMPYSLTGADEHGYWQAFQAGQAVGALFVVTQQLITLLGVHALKQRPGTYTYAGAARLHDPQLIEAMQALLQALVPDAGLVGINSIDAIWHNGRLHVLEINPRLSASMRLYAHWPLIQAHIASCQAAEMPVLLPNGKHASHCIWYALQPIKSEQLDFPAWLEDRPDNGMIAAGQPICSVYAEGCSEGEVQQILQDRKTQLEKIWGTYVCEHIEFNIY